MTATLLRLPAVMERTGLKRSTLYKRVREGSFPKPVAIGPQGRAWVDTEVDAWIAEVIDQSRKQTASK